MTKGVTKHWSVAWLLALFMFLVMTCSSMAGPIDPREINLAAQSLIVDSEFSFLQAVYGSDTSSVLRYGAWVDAEGWEGRLEGTYLGKPLAVDYVAALMWTSALEATITYNSNGTWGGDAWLGDGVSLYVDPIGVSGALGNTMRVGVGATSGTVSLDVTLEKKVLQGELSAEVTAGVLQVPYLGAAIAAGGGFRLDQRTGKDQSYLKWEALWGLVGGERVLNRTSLWTVPNPPQKPRKPITPPPPPVYPPWYETYPDTSQGGTPGFDPNNPNSPGYEAMYLGTPVPEPSTFMFVGGGMLGFFFFLARRRQPYKHE